MEPCFLYQVYIYTVIFQFFNFPFIKVVEIDAETLDWQHFLYRGIRSVRRERNYLALPSDEETDACRKAYDMAPNCAQNLFNMATLYGDILKNYNPTLGKTCKLIDELGKDGIGEQLLWFTE